MEKFKRIIFGVGRFLLISFLLIDLFLIASRLLFGGYAKYNSLLDFLTLGFIVVVLFLIFTNRSSRYMWASVAITVHLLYNELDRVFRVTKGKFERTDFDNIIFFLFFILLALLLNYFSRSGGQFDQQSSSKWSNIIFIILAVFLVGLFGIIIWVNSLGLHR
ncbi:hypothetical protein A2662_01385 [Candidatus Giovannonibacteria bacterium RIFCSPHIGHO2_01_FULL_45_33]|uniref:Uncharacterized protein n=1 Tax=Candidatus Giovannonibacteria bacterium RIFCSPLOWO2_01_FULL_45_34 TaxID=1798351 RepID=A0A1F5WZT5_9BACT|nr:MAG: hypothetical protein A2662_01385 [Candidatus Giovannonibacteria bacterium RIFCSPHIGHO2_01_FULL_45_33]OGF69689.1 MAG: hypothetical protein A3C73_00105 [Candidatus Giovannonibacteria bacterium RIFCSPHIGHO2_02_FULL_44_11]OGF81147.1 MAG: hypothetical protein A2930_01100 [Candidatus Giovannonibacteria bacterium RIFCSPLOWO2_01_FULL_45_34]